MPIGLPGPRPNLDRTKISNPAYFRESVLVAVVQVPRKDITKGCNEALRKAVVAGKPDAVSVVQPLWIRTVLVLFAKNMELVNSIANANSGEYQRSI